MNSQKHSINDIFHKQLFWLDTWFSTDKKELISFVEKEHEAIFDDLVKNWKTHYIDILLSSVSDRYGKKNVQEVIEKVVAANNRKEWSDVAEKKGSNSIDDLVGILLTPIQGKDGFEFTLEDQNGGVQMHCTKCPHVTLERALGNAGWIYSFVCSGDPHIVAGFNEQMGFKRSKTLVEGHECCNHFYFIKKSGGKQ